MSIEKFVEQDFQALETSVSRDEKPSKVALKRILENIEQLGDADRIFHWYEELRRIGLLPPAETPIVEAAQGTDIPSVTDPAPEVALPPAEEQAATDSFGAK